MPSRDQVAFHNNEEMRKRAQEAALAQQAQQQQAAQGYQVQSALMAQQHGYGQQQAAQQYGYQSALSAQGAHQQGQLAEQHVDLQARLSQVQLNQAEVQRMNRMHQARAAVEDNPDLSRQERNMLITQIESGLNPLENRQRESQMLQSHLQSEGLAQQNQQQATLFNQRQERLQAGMAGRMQVATDPLTGRQQLFQMDLNGEMHPLDFSQAQQHHEMQMQAMRTQIEGQQQQQAQSGQLFPGTLQTQQLTNERMTQAMQQAAQLQPHQLEHARLTNASIVQHLAQGADTHVLNQISGYAHLGDLRQRVQHAADLHPGNLNLQEANVELARQRWETAQAESENAPERQEAEREYRRAQIDHLNALTRAADNRVPVPADDRARREYANHLSTTTRHYEDAARHEYAAWQNRVQTEVQRQRATTPAAQAAIAAAIPAPSWWGARGNVQSPEEEIRHYAEGQALQHLHRSGIRNPDAQPAPIQAVPAQGGGQPNPAPAPQGAPPFNPAAQGGNGPAPLGEVLAGFHQLGAALPGPQREAFEGDLIRIQRIMGNRQFGQLTPQERQQVLVIRARIQAAAQQAAQNTQR